MEFSRNVRLCYLLMSFLSGLCFKLFILNIMKASFKAFCCGCSPWKTVWHLHCFCEIGICWRTLLQMFSLLTRYVIQTNNRNLYLLCQLKLYSEYGLARYNVLVPNQLSSKRNGLWVFFPFRKANYRKPYAQHFHRIRGLRTVRLRIRSTSRMSIFRTKNRHPWSTSTWRSTYRIIALRVYAITINCKRGVTAH